MREVPDVSKKRIELSVPQVAGSAVAAVVAAKLASYFGVYGTILGAGVVSAIATSGGTVFQHFFSRTGAQLREAKVTSRDVVTSREPGQPPRAPASSPRARSTARGWAVGSARCSPRPSSSVSR